jgi:hypothetical protein
MIVFVHIERTAGTSLHNAFIPHFPGRHSIISNERNLARVPRDAAYLGGHFSLAVLESHGFAKPEDFLFSIVRNPVDRMVSLYHLMLRSPDWLSDLHRKVGGRGIDYFLDLCLEHGTYTANQQCRRIAGRPDFFAARDAIQSRYDLLGCLANVSAFVDALSDRMRPSIPAFEYTGSCRNHAPKVESPNPSLVRRIEKDCSEDMALNEYVERAGVIQKSG